MTGIILRGVALGAAAVALLLTGCSADPAPLPGAGTTTPSPSVTTPSVTPTPTPTAPALPVAAQAGTEAGAEAFIRYFWDTYNYLLATGDAAPLQKIKADECVYCESAVADYRATVGAGQAFQGGKVTVETIAVPPGQEMRNLLANVLISQQAMELVEGTRTLDSFDPTPTTASDIVLEYTANGWRVVEIEVKS